MNTAFNPTPIANVLGATASALCLVHCLSTPILFTIHAGQLHHHHEGHPFWWGMLDIFFICISIVAVYWSAKNTSKPWMKYALWSSALMLASCILNEKVMLMTIPEQLIYLPAIALVILHLYNRKYCQCTAPDCCENTANNGVQLRENP